MANLILRLKRNQETGEQELLVDYESDGDRLAFEHEEDHRRWLRKVIDDSEADGDSESVIQVDRPVISSGQDSSEQSKEKDLGVSNREKLKA